MIMTRTLSQAYQIYYTTNPASTAFENYAKVRVSTSSLGVQLQKLQPETVYAFCISTVYKSGHSPISKVR